MDKVHVSKWLHTTSVKPTAGNRARFFPSLFLISTSSFLFLTEVFRNGYVAACSTAAGSATEENESRGYLTVPYPSKLTQHTSTAEWLNF